MLINHFIVDFSLLPDLLFPNMNVPSVEAAIEAIIDADIDYFLQQQLIETCMFFFKEDISAAGRIFCKLIETNSDTVLNKVNIPHSAPTWMEPILSLVISPQISAEKEGMLDLIVALLSFFQRNGSPIAKIHLKMLCEEFSTERAMITIRNSFKYSKHNIRNLLSIGGVKLIGNLLLFDGKLFGKYFPLLLELAFDTPIALLQNDILSVLEAMADKYSATYFTSCREFMDKVKVLAVSLEADKFTEPPHVVAVLATLLEKILKDGHSSELSEYLEVFRKRLALKFKAPLKTKPLSKSGNIPVADQLTKEEILKKEDILKKEEILKKEIELMRIELELEKAKQTGK